MRQRAGVIGVSAVFLLLLLAVGAGLFATHSPFLVSRDRFMTPSLNHLLGTDHLGRDLWSRLVFASHVSLRVSLISVALSAGLGSLSGLVAGYVRGIIETIIMRTMDILLALPGLLLALALIAVFGPSEPNVIIAIGLTSVPIFGRLVYAQTLAVAEEEFIPAARLLGERPSRILFLHILPNVLAPILVMISLRIASAMLTEASLGFLGLGVPPPQPSWGGMVAEGRSFLLTAPWIPLFPGLMISYAVLAFNILGDGLRDALDPRLRSSAR